jgi:hypothetical protein
MNSVFRKLTEQIKEKARSDAFGTTDAANRRAEIPQGFHRLEAGTVLTIGDLYWRHTFKSFLPFDEEQIRICGTVLACEVVIRPDNRETCLISIPAFTLGDFARFMHGVPFAWRFPVGIKRPDVPRSRVVIEIDASETTMRERVKSPGASFEYVTEFLKKEGSK